VAQARASELGSGAPSPTGPTVGKKEAIWLACKRKTCCHNPFVVPTGRDVWRISRTLHVPPESFLFYFPAREARRDAFILEKSGPGFRLALGKGPARRKGAARPCIFLLRTRAGEHRCGLGALRPIVCQAFLGALHDGVLSLESGVCACREWSLADVDVDEEVALVEARQHASEEYCQVVARWNERVEAAGEGARVTVADFCTYLLEAYDRLAAGETGTPR
jgi:hypothetical protein